MQYFLRFYDDKSFVKPGMRIPKTSCACTNEGGNKPSDNVAFITRYKVVLPLICVNDCHYNRHMAIHAAAGREVNVIRTLTTSNHVPEINPVTVFI